jgi:nucleoid-associated protein YgaU
MKLNNIVLLLLVVSFISTGCAKRKAAPVPSSDSSDVSMDFLDSFEEDDLFAMDSSFSFEDGDDAFLHDSRMSPAISSGGSVAQGVSGNQYIVQSGDTLMFIAYKIYGDYRLWNRLARSNNLNAGSSLKTGQALNIDASLVRELPRIDGRPYIIRSGDSLSKISKAHYGTYNQWKPLWQHNSHMIKDPNIIFAGFQMYLLPDRQLASQ